METELQNALRLQTFSRELVQSLERIESRIENVSNESLGNML